MALPSATLFVIFALALSGIHPSTCHSVVRGSVSCLDCLPRSDLSGIRVSVKCDEVKGSTVVTTKDTGFFEAKLPSNPKNPKTCLAELLGGPTRLFAFKNSMVSKVVMPQNHHPSSYYTISTPLSFYAACPLSQGHEKCRSSSANPTIGSSKTVDLPLPPEWGLAPSSYYVPFFPIIGIP